MSLKIRELTTTNLIQNFFKATITHNTERRLLHYFLFISMQTFSKNKNICKYLEVCILPGWHNSCPYKNIFRWSFSEFLFNFWSTLLIKISTKFSSRLWKVIRVATLNWNCVQNNNSVDPSLHFPSNPTALGSNPRRSKNLFEPNGAQHLGTLSFEANKNII